MDLTIMVTVLSVAIATLSNSTINPCGSKVRMLASLAVKKININSVDIVRRQ